MVFGAFITTQARSTMRLDRENGKTRFSSRFLGLSILKHGNKWQVSITLCKIQTISHDEMIGYRKSNIIDRHLSFASVNFVEQRHQFHAGCATRFQIGEQIRKRQSSINDVLNYYDVAPFHRHSEILQDAHLSRGSR